VTLKTILQYNNIHLVASDIEMRSAGATENWEFKSINFGGDDVGGLALAAREQRLPALRREAPRLECV